jgi:hypothetical protein
MTAHRRRFLATLEDPLEKRVVPGHVAPILSPLISLPQAIAIKYGSQTHPTGWAQKQGTSQTITYYTGGLPHRHQLVFTVKPVRSPNAQIAAQEAADPHLNSFKLSYHNQGNHALATATLVVRLNPGLHYIPGNELLPPSSKLTESTDSSGIQTLSLSFPDGMPAGAIGYLIFQTKNYGP